MKVVLSLFRSCFKIVLKMFEAVLKFLKAILKLFKAVLKLLKGCFEGTVVLKIVLKHV